MYMNCDIHGITIEYSNSWPVLFVRGWDTNSVIKIETEEKILLTNKLLDIVSHCGRLFGYQNRAQAR